MDGGETEGCQLGCRGHPLGNYEIGKGGKASGPKLQWTLSQEGSQGNEENGYKGAGVGLTRKRELTGCGSDRTPTLRIGPSSRRMDAGTKNQNAHHSLTAPHQPNQSPHQEKTQNSPPHTPTTPKRKKQPNPNKTKPHQGGEVRIVGNLYQWLLDY